MLRIDSEAPKYVMMVNQFFQNIVYLRILIDKRKRMRAIMPIYALNQMPTPESKEILIYCRMAFNYAIIFNVFVPKTGL